MNSGLTLFLIILTCGIVVLLLRFVIIQIRPKGVEVVKRILDQGRIHKAVQGAKRILAKNQGNGDAHYLLAKAYLMTDKRELAFLEYRTVAKIAVFSDICPEAEFRKEIASLYLEFGEREEALKEFILLIELKPDDATNYYRAGLLFEERGNSNKAASYYKKAIELNPNFPDALNAYGTIMYNARFPVEAKASLMKAIQLKPGFPQAYLYLGHIYKDAKNYANALVAFERALSAHELKRTALIERGICYQLMKNYHQSQIELERALDPPNNELESSEILHARYHLSISYEKLRRIDKAVEQWELISKISRNFRDVSKKLSKYKLYSSNDLIKDFIIVSPADFERICRKIVEILKYSIISYQSLKEGALIKAEKKYGNNLHQVLANKVLIKILRSPDDINRSDIREFNELLNSPDLRIGYFISCSEFVPSAREFAAIRRIEIIDRNQLLPILKRISKTRSDNP